MRSKVFMDAHMQAFDWLEAHLEENLFMIDTDDIVGLIEQVVMQ